MPILFQNGVVHSLDPQDSKYEAIVTSGPKISAVGKSSDLRRDFPEADVFDLGGNHLYPGFVDAHAHAYGMGERLTKPRLENTRSKEEIYTILKPLTDSGAPTDSRAWTISRGWDQTTWATQAFPNCRDLDQNVSQSKPIALTRIDGHALWCNSKALEIAGIDRTTPDPAGGTIHRDASGEATGILIDEAMKLVERRIPPATTDDLAETLRHGLRYFLRRGHIAVHEMGVSEELWNAYCVLYARHGESLPRAYIFLDMTKETGNALFRTWMENPSRIPDARESGNFSFAGIKLYLDGALGSRGANLFEEYSDDPGNCGLALMDDNEALELIRMAARHPLQIAVHAIGDRANARALDLFEKVGYRHPQATLRIEHAQIVRDEDIARYKNLGVFALVQPAFYSSDRRWAIDRLGAMRMQSAYRWRSFVEAGVRMVASSDAPIEEPDAIEGIRILTTRMGDSTAESVERNLAIRAYCKTAHLLTHQKDAGMLAPGMQADMTIVSDDQNSVRGVVLRGRVLREE